uniref:EF-hand domain-containing protein n=1 Tax=Knipowitschia caucasica TaxID=637954 RepID=A0AAV2M1Z4_KNICA
MEICPMELKNILDDVCRKSGVAIGEGGFSIETCRSMVAGIFVKFDRDRSGCISEQELPSALSAAVHRMELPLHLTAPPIPPIPPILPILPPSPIPICTGPVHVQRPLVHVL